MKKQLVILLMVFFAIGLTSAFGQLAPRPITCLSSDALHPVAGTPYSYTVNVPTPPGDKTYTWLVTQDQTFVTSGNLVATPQVVGGSILAAASGWYNTPTLDAVTISLTWQSFAYNPANPVFVVIFVKNTTASCVSQNVKVYKIEPNNAFTLDIANQNAARVTQAGYGTNIDRCISDIVSSTYDATSPEGIINDYGADTLYYEVVAANWSEAWNPSVQLTNIDPLEHVTVEWTKDATYAGGFNAMAGATNGTGGTPTVYTSATNVTPTSGTFVGATGESIYIRVILDHSNLTDVSWEGLTDQVIALAVDGVTVPTTGTGVGDVHTEAGGSPSTCPWVDLFANDIATQTLKSRPDIQAVTPTPFLPTKP
jgi:hypothetical protein